MGNAGFVSSTVAAVSEYVGECMMVVYPGALGPGESEEHIVRVFGFRV